MSGIISIKSVSGGLGEPALQLRQRHQQRLGVGGRDCRRIDRNLSCMELWALSGNGRERRAAVRTVKFSVCVLDFPDPCGCLVVVCKQIWSELQRKSNMKYDPQKASFLFGECLHPLLLLFVACHNMELGEC